MEQIKRRTKGLGLVILLMAIIIGIKCKKVVLSPNDYLIGNSLDGFRSYMAADYHLQHDTTFHHFSGMNHPYGDRNDYTDNLPILINSIKFISNHFTDLTPWMTGIWNYFLLFSLLLTGVFLYLILRQLDLPLWYAVPIAVGLSFLSPQITRMDVHYGLAHPFIIPMIIYLLLRFEAKPAIWRSILIGGSLWVFTLFHFYLFIIPLMIVGFYHGIKLLRNRTAVQFKSTLLHGSIQVLIPFIIVLLGSTLFDPVSDRCEWPYGLLAYRAYWQSVFFPQNGLLGKLISSTVPPRHAPSSENTAYIGFVGMISFLLLLAFCRKIFRKKPPIASVPVTHHEQLTTLLLAGLLLLALSFSLPFGLPGLKDNLAWTGPFRQFRSVGRFAWGFFYIINIFAFYYGFHLIKGIQKKGWQKFLLLAIVVIIVADGFSYFFKKEWLYHPHPRDRKYFKEQDNPWLKNFDSDSYQAMLPVPIFAIGSENIWRQVHSPIMHRSLWASVSTGLPVIGYYMGRTSISQTYNFIEFVSPPYREPAILADLPNEKDILIFGEKGNIRDVPENYEHLWKDLAHFYEDGQLILYRLPIQTIRERVAAAHEKVIKESRDSTLIAHGDWWSTDSIKNFTYRSFDETPASHTYSGDGAYEKSGYPNSLLFKAPLENGVSGAAYDVSFWLRILPDLRGLLDVFIEEENPETGERVAGVHVNAGNCIKHIDGEWALIQQTYTLNKADSQLKISIGHYKLKHEKIQLDELVIRPVETYLYRKKAGRVWKGNLHYPDIALPDSTTIIDQ